MFAKTTTYCLLAGTMLAGQAFTQIRRPAPGMDRQTTPYTLRLDLDRQKDSPEQLILYLSTRKRYNHGGYQIDLTQTTGDGKLAIGITGISTRPGMHTQAFAPARGTVLIPKEKGTLEITITENGKTDALTLLITDDAISLTGDTKNPLLGALSLNYNLPPPNLFYVMVLKRRDSDAEDLTSTILKDFAALPNLKEWTPKREPYLCKAWKYPNRFITYFVMSDSLDWAAIRTVVEKHKTTKHMLITATVPQDGRQVKNY